ncbi:hypothetical protein XI03_07825 [Bradyrhizobium sp. CCBAU 65884]|uniref:hypothetical protein n=1 Tax=Bradyrhizobium sp. CCBAU 65884 TaxID=722477 RepID=UPI002305926D|nr:hypothetical protein [Bradyrhizobium sp. CCBAU 65884]MDA9474411.1 hypothetical protein [Bradyrhizobium sp. CCBAU 65884]
MKTNRMPTDGFALLVDGLVKTEFEIREGAQRGASDLKQRFPSLKIGIYDAVAKRAEPVEA